MKYLNIALRLLVAIILLQTLYFKFTGAPESIYIFSTLGMEPWGRWVTGIVEFFASLLLLLPSTQALGALVSLGVISGALMGHLTILGIEVQNDGGALFILALVVFVASILILLMNKSQIFDLIKRVKAAINSSH